MSFEEGSTRPTSMESRFAQMRKNVVLGVTRVQSMYSHWKDREWDPGLTSLS
jgi:hypothetical protein